jgi:spore maturation protein SpmA
MNRLFFILITLAILLACYHQIFSPENHSLFTLETALLKAADDAVKLGISLVGTMAFFLGLLKISEESGVLTNLSLILRPILYRLFPEIPQNHPAMGSMVMNVSANMLGLSNAATPFGIKAMKHLNELNHDKKTASNAMILFMAINTANVTLLPTHILALRLATGSHHPEKIIITTLFSTIGATLFALIFTKFIHSYSADKYDKGEAQPLEPEYSHSKSFIGIIITCLIFLGCLMKWGEIISPWIIPVLLLTIFLNAAHKKVQLFDSFIKGAREGIKISIRILPYLIAVLILVSVVQESGLMALLIKPISQIFAPIGLPSEAITMAFLRSMSGSASFGYLASLLQNPSIGPDSYIGLLTSTIYGSSETTFYVLAVYFGAVGIHNIRHALAIGLLTDLVALIFSVIICKII